MPRPRPVLVLGYGNPARRDDGLGPALARRIAAMEIPGVQVRTAYQLNVEDAELVSRHDVVVFVDACLQSPPPFGFRELEPGPDTLEFTTHSLAPEGVLGLARSLFGASTRGFAVGVRGYDLHEMVESLTADAAVNLEETLTWMVRALEPGGALNPETIPTGTPS